MRIIKFRAWDKDLEGWMDAAQGTMLSISLAFKNSVVLEQFTGLHDKTVRRFTRGIWYLLRPTLLVTKKG